MGRTGSPPLHRGAYSSAAHSTAAWSRRGREDSSAWMARSRLELDLNPHPEKRRVRHPRKILNSHPERAFEAQGKRMRHPRKMRWLTLGLLACTTECR